MQGNALPDELELLRQIKDHDEQALATVFDTYYEPLYRYIYHYVGHASTAEDLTAEVFRRFLDQLEKRRGPKRYLKAWLYRVARNLSIDEMRRQARRQHSELNESITATGQDVASQAHQSILQEQARAALAVLTPKQRDVVILRFLEGLENDEVAHILGLTVGAVKALQHRGLTAMRRHLVLVGAVTEEY